MSDLFGLANSIVSAPFTLTTNLLGGVLGGGSGSSGNPLSGIEGMFGSGFLQLIAPIVMLFVGVELFFKLIDKI
jgi:hypothetical protein